MSLASGPFRRRRARIAAAVVGVLVLAVGVSASMHEPTRQRVGAAVENITGTSRSEFPDIDVASLSPTQRRFVELMRTEFEEQPPGTKYAAGVEEPWCADFVSWTRKQLDTPLVNPHSGSWRIPGVWTLTEHLQAVGAFRAPGEHTPVTGDVMLWDPDSSFTHHVNFVLTVEGDSIITIGGNEYGAIRISVVDATRLDGFAGYGAIGADAP